MVPNFAIVTRIASLLRMVEHTWKTYMKNAIKFPFIIQYSLTLVLKNLPFVIPWFFQVFVFLLSFLVTLQQALSSGYINSVITTIEKRFEIPSSLSGVIASSYEIGNVITVIFVSYLGSRRHIPVWIAIGEWMENVFDFDC